MRQPKSTEEGKKETREQRAERLWQNVLPFLTAIRNDARTIRKELPLQATPVADDLRIGEPGYRTKKKGGSPPPDYEFIILLADLETAINRKDLENAMYSAILLRRYTGKDE